MFPIGYRMFALKMLSVCKQRTNYHSGVVQKGNLVLESCNQDFNVKHSCVVANKILFST